MLEFALPILLSIASIAALWRTRLLVKPLPPPAPTNLSLLGGSFLVGLCLWIGITGAATAAFAKSATPAATLPATSPASPILANPQPTLLAILLGYAIAITAMAGFRFILPRAPTRFAAGAQASLAAIALVLAWPLVMLAGALTVLLLKSLGITVPTEHDLISLLKSHRDLLPLITLSAAFAAPIFEELLFRGHLQPLLSGLFAKATSTTTARYASIAVTSLLFSLLHPPFSIPAIFLLSLALGLLYEHTGRLLPCILCHIGFNAISLILALLGVGT